MSSEQLLAENKRLQLELEIAKANGKPTMAEKLRLNIGTVITIVAVACAGMVKLSSIENKIDAASSDRWRASHMRAWTYRLYQENIAIKLMVPSSDVIKREVDQP